uniref:Uncharacterized protein n=2 Tax=Aegilops tauschii subsp. strangulata TaxID=200361 RepID=A0A453KUV4_AEGTS
SATLDRRSRADRARRSPETERWAIPELRTPPKYLAYVPSPPPLGLIYKTPPAPSLQQRRKERRRIHCACACATHTLRHQRFDRIVVRSMGLLDQLWDDTVAGPRPDHGLGRLRKYASFSPSSAAAGTTAAVPSADVAAPAVTRSITILRPPALSVTSPRGESGSGSAPSSPASVPDSPFGTGILSHLCLLFLSRTTRPA